MKTNGARRSDEILREIDSTRSDMDHTLAAIEGRLTPGQLLDQGLDYVRGSGANEYVHNLGRSVKENPLPVALVGIGLAWLMAGGRSHDGAANDASASASGVRSKLSDAKDRLSGATQGVKERAGHAQQAMSEKMQSARERVSRTADGARHQLDRAREGYDWMLREQPLALGAIGIAVGALLAAAAPRTRKEDELMGEQRDELMDEAREAGREQLDKVRHVADAAASAAANEAERQGVAPAAASRQPPASPSPSPAPAPSPTPPMQQPGSARPDVGGI